MSPAASDPPEGAERLQKILARAGVASRRKAEELLRAGRVRVNGRMAGLGDRAGPADRVTVDGRDVARRSAHVTYLLHKPVDVLSTASDERGRATVLDLVPPEPGLHPVGRLDKDSEGALLLTTDGELTLRLSHPRYGVEKEYRVWCEPPAVSDEALRRLRSGVELEDGTARVRRARRAAGGCVVVLTEGRKREVRRMLDAVGYRVVRLRRERFGPIRLGDLPPGAHRRLRREELAALRGDDGETP